MVVDVPAAGLLDPPLDSTGAGRWMKAVGGLTAVSIATSALALLTGPLQARLLGPTGRGELATILVVTAIAAPILGLGLNAFVAREVARGTPERSVLGTTTAMALVLGLAGWALAWPVAGLMATRGSDVHTLIVVGFLLVPLAIVGQTLLGVAWGRERWRLLAVTQFVAQSLLALAFVLLAVAGWFTVTSAAIASFVAAIVACGPFLWLLRSARTWTVERTTARHAARFGIRTTLGSVALLGNQRCDQLVLAATFPPRQLGLYVVAVNLAAVGHLAVAALNYVMLPTVASGRRDAIKPVLRVTIWGMALSSAAVVLAAPVLVRILFGGAFSASVPLVQVLASGAVFIAGSGLLSAALSGDGRPGEAALSEGLALGVTVVLLIVLLPKLGTMGAAVASVCAYAVSFTFLLHRARRWFGGSLADYLLLRRSDVRRVVAAMRGARGGARASSST